MARVALLVGAGALALAVGLWVRADRPDVENLLLERPAGHPEPLVPAGTPPGLRPAGPAELVVQAGDTLWDLAMRCAGPYADPRRWVEVVRRLNGVSDPSRLQPGQTLSLPGGLYGCTRQPADGGS